MPAVKKKDLHLSNSVGELNKMAGNLPDCKNVRLCVSSAQKLFKKAEETDLLGDEEAAYVLYMRYFNLISSIKKTVEYKKNEKLYKDLIGMKNLLKAMDEAEKLSDSLKHRYEEREAVSVSKKLEALNKKTLEMEKEREEKEQKDKEKETKNAESENGQTATEEPTNPHFLPVVKLYSLIQDPETSLLIIDVRNKEEYLASHICHANCINVPANIVPPGCTVTKIEKGLPDGSKDLWERRGLVDFIILIDWLGSEEDLKVRATLSNLKDALYKWDQKTIIKSEPIVLAGGYNDLLLYYPMLATNAHVPRPSSATTLSSTVPSLESIDYDLELNFLKSPEELAKEQSNKDLTIENLTDKFKENNINVTPSIPSVDRSVKPKPPNAKVSNIPDGTVLNTDRSKPFVKPPLDFKLNEIRNELMSGGTTKPNKNTNIRDQGKVEIPKPVQPQVSRHLKPATHNEQDKSPDTSVNDSSLSGESSSTSSRTSSIISLDGTTVSPKHNDTPPSTCQDRYEGKTTLTEDDVHQIKKDNQRLVLEHKARLAKLKTEQEQMSNLQQLKSQEVKETASLLRTKKQIQDEILQLEVLLEEKEKRMAAEEEKWIDEQLRRRKLLEDEQADLTKVPKEPEVKSMDLAPEQKARDQTEEERLKAEEQKKSQSATLQVQKDKEQQEQKRQAEAKAKEERLKLERIQQEKLRLEQEQKEKAEKAAQESRKQEDKIRKEREEQLKKLQEQKLQKEKEEKMRKEQERKKMEQEETAKKERLRLEKERQEKLKKQQEEKTRLEMEKKKAEETSTATEGRAKEASRSKLVTPGLKVGWEKRLDSNTGRYYYVDHKTKKTQWEPPQIVVQQQAPGNTYKTRLKDEHEQPTSGGLKRSHSSPNIAKMMEDEERDRIRPQPSVDRAAKPPPKPETKPVTLQTEVSAAKVRNLQPVWGRMGRGLTGLKNLGNTCYMNSIIQCLSNTLPLTMYFLTDNYSVHINRENIFGKGGEVAEEFAVLIKTLWNGQYKSVSPRDFKLTVAKYHELFAGYSQQDSQELLLFLMDGLHEDLNRVVRRKSLPEQDNDGIPDEQAANTAWRLHKTVNESVIVELFQGQFKSTVRCLTCGKKSVTFDAFMYLTLPIPSATRCTLKECLLQFAKEEKMTGDSQWHCPRCKCPRDAVKQIVIWKLPPILLIHLKRFYYQGMWRQKITSYVDYPLDGLELSNYVAGPKLRRPYSLYGVSNHYGSLDGGHYTAYCKNSTAQRWYKYDDHEVYDISSRDIQSSAAYILFYTNMDLAPLFK